MFRKFWLPHIQFPVFPHKAVSTNAPLSIEASVRHRVLLHLPRSPQNSNNMYEPHPRNDFGVFHKMLMTFRDRVLRIEGYLHTSVPKI